MKTARYLLPVLCLLTITPAFGQVAEGGDFMHSIGKIYVVLAVVLAIFIAIILFLVFLERKLTKLENQIQQND
ncbi:MAG: CcmD family protein [Saprospiraceae bacterium]|nr:CcmD family protein [Saprospiraceae bacterium]MCB0626093.1 CcmD family protein [Saprospiraceae bacterium]MCB0676920.1 CcmD family protein [Saprospiraceae bacterium]MCB0680986.1 CcmD family protein [Saprospiraceae bacterium]